LLYTKLQACPGRMDPPPHTAIEHKPAEPKDMLLGEGIHTCKHQDIKRTRIAETEISISRRDNKLLFKLVIWLKYDVYRNHLAKNLPIQTYTT
jgi:hypothetical protein